MHWKHHALLAIIVALAAHPVAASAPPQEAELRRAFAAAKSGTLSEVERDVLRRNPLLPWLDAIQFKQGIAANSAPLPLIRSNPQDASTAWLVGQWRNELIRRQDWPAAAQWLNAYPDSGIGSTCVQLLAVDPARRDAAWQKSALALWRGESKAPAYCSAVFDALAGTATIDSSTAWQRFDRLLADDAESRLAEVIAVMSADDATLANRYRSVLNDPSADPAGLPRDARTARVLHKGLMTLARNDPSRAASLWKTTAATFAFTPEQNTAIQQEIALWSLVNYLPEAEARYLALPEAARSANLREWYMRFQFSENNDTRTLAAFDQLLPVQQQEARWQYFKGRVLERLGMVREAKLLFAAAAHAANFHGWLAADRIGADYRFCPLEQHLSAKQRAALRGAFPGLDRALWLWQLGESNYAIWEWNAVFTQLDSAQQREAVAMAQDIGWYDRSVFSLEASALNQRYYSLRFATPYADDFLAAAKQFGIDRAWLSAHARAESIFMPNVTSTANARGLLQLLPTTAEAIAARNGIVWQGPESLYRPEVNILLGAGALHDVIETYRGKAYQAIAAYNAGPTAVNRWLAARDRLDADFWIETIPYKETREYVPRVLSFSVIYDWRLRQPVRPISQRVEGDFRPDFEPATLRCPTPVTEKKRARG